MIRVAIVAPAMAIRVGLQAILSDDAGIQIVAEGSNFAEITGLQNAVDVVIWSPSPAIDPESLRIDIQRVEFGDSTALLMISSDQYIVEELNNLVIRAWGVIDPEASQAELIASIHAVNEGLAVVNPMWIKQAFIKHSYQLDDDETLIEPLTEREAEILQLLANGLTNKQIAARLKISAHTVKFHLSSIFNKMGTTNRVETVKFGLKMGLIVL